MKIYFILVCLSVFLINSFETANAIPPPDFLFNIGSQVVQVFSVIVIFLSAFVAAFRQFAKTYFYHLRYKKIVWAGIALVVIGVAFVGSHFYKQYKQEAEYQKWIAQSQQQNADYVYGNYDLDKLRIDGDKADDEVRDENDAEIGIDDGGAVTKDSDDSDKVEDSLPEQNLLLRYDDNMRFIQQYYQYLNDGDLDAAYEVSKKSASLETYRSWYQDVDFATVDDMQKISENIYSLQISLVENGKITVYAVLMTIDIGDPQNLKIADSEVRVLSVSDVNETPVIENVQIVDAENFFEENQNVPLEIGNAEFKSIVDSGSDIFVLDAREDEEYEIGYFPESTHIRFADLIAGQWISLPTDKVIYVFCWSGIRGEEVAKFLREKQILARFISTGADGWVSFGGTWMGGIKFLVAHPEERFQKIFSTSQVRQMETEGVQIVDSRIQDRYEEWHIPGSVNIPVIYTTSNDMDAVLAQVLAGSRVITVCDDFVSCFDAKLTGLKLERLGYEFLGRYNTPWDYRNSM